MIRLVVFAAALVAYTNAAHAETMPPRDECGAVEGADAFRMTLTTAVANRDEERLLALAAPDVLLDFGGGSGREMLRERLDGAENLWAELDELLVLGCAALDEGGLSLPYYFSQDFGDRDAFETYLVQGTRVPLYAASDGDRVVRYLDWEIVALDRYPGGDPAAGIRSEVALADGSRGFVDAATLRSLVDYRLFAMPGDDGRLRMTVLVAGD